MPSKIIVICAALICSGLTAAYYLTPNNLFSEPMDNDSILVKNEQLIPNSISEIPTAPVVKDSAPLILLAKSSILELETELASTVLKREYTEEALRVIELKVGALEAQLDDIEMRGDNPADVQDETLDSFQAIFADYQDAIMAFEKIKAKEDWLVTKISETKK